MKVRVAILAAVVGVIALGSFGCSGSTSAQAVQTKEQQLDKIAKDKAKSTTPPGQDVTPSS